MVYFAEEEKEKERVAKNILAQLPDWFGLPESTKEYVMCSRKMPFWMYKEGEKEKGFIALKETSPYTAELYVMGVLKDEHRKGIGTQLFGALSAYAKQKGYEFLQVKTVQKGHYKEYDQTNAFYEKMGFRELECLPTLWDEWNPCQIYIKTIKG